MRTSTLRAVAAALALVVSLGCGPAPERRPAPPPQAKVRGVRLLVVVVVDQLGWDELARFRPALNGGLARLLDDGGVVFTDAHHRHARTVTAPGHATLVTGLSPRHHGIVANSWFDRELGRRVEATEDPLSGEVGPANLLATSIPDWVRQRDPWGRTFAAGGKDRSATMLGGKRPTGVFWYDPQERGFTTSRSYRHAPVWVAEFNRRPLLRERLGTLWQPLPLPAGIDASRLGVVQLDGAELPRPFPHAYGPATTTPGIEFYEALGDTPVGDEYLAAFARELVIRERLGVDDHLDYLALSFSAVDKVGHVYGPHSREALDALLRLDHVLEGLLAFLDESVGRSHLLVALSSDHGVAPMPERQQRLGLRGSRVSPSQAACVQSLPGRLDAAHGERDWFVHDLYLDPLAVARSRVDRATLDREVARWLGQCPGVVRAWTRAELSPDELSGDPVLDLFRASYLPARSPDFVVQWAPGFVLRERGTTHGTPYPYDTHVPLVLRVPGVPGHRIDRRVATADLAPTLAALLGLRPPRALDGHDRSELVLGPPR
jgi:hypothetical protein